MNHREPPSVTPGMHQRLLPRLHLVSLATAILLVVGLAACGSDDGTTTGTTTDDAGATTTAAPADDYRATTTAAPAGDDGAAAPGTIVAEDFSLTDVTAGPGDELVLDNQGSAPHTATADDGAFDLGRVDGGATSEPATAPEEPGSYPFHCEIHKDMTATLTVEG